MKKSCVFASVLMALCLGGCGENVTSADAHVCTHFYDTVTKTASQTPYEVSSDNEIVLEKEHVTYALSLVYELDLSNLDTNIDLNNLTPRGTFDIQLNRTGKILRVTTSNLEPTFSLMFNSIAAIGVMNDECDVQSFDYNISNQAASSKIPVVVTSKSPKVLLTYEIFE